MTRALLVSAAVCFFASSSFACEYQRSAQTSQTSVDPTVVASVAVPQSEAPSASNAVIQQEADVPAK